MRLFADLASYQLTHQPKFAPGARLGAVAVRSGLRPAATEGAAIAADTRATRRLPYATEATDGDLDATRRRVWPPGRADFLASERVESAPQARPTAGKWPT